MDKRTNTLEWVDMLTQPDRRVGGQQVAVDRAAGKQHRAVAGRVTGESDRFTTQQTPSARGEREHARLGS
jgi:hypothetical protein